MANSGASAEAIARPTGGGAIKGIGETFAPDLFTGTGNFTVPIALPPGRNGFQPSLSLGYSTGNGNGPFGLGWALSVPEVGRKTPKGVPRYDDETDVFVLSGAEDLVPVSGTFPGQIVYRPRTEGLFARITRHRDAANDFWKVESKDGLISFYGTPGAAGADPAVIADPAKRSKVFAWKLSETLDAFGNRIVYDYERDTAREGPRHWDQLYLKRVRYVDYDDATSGEARFLVSVAFDYGGLEAGRPDPFSDYRAGFEIRTRRRCQSIVVETHAERIRRMGSVELVYLDQRVVAGELPERALPLNGVSLLSQVRVVGHDDDQAAEEDRLQTLPPLEFGYTGFDPESRRFSPLKGPLEGEGLPAASLASPDLELADLFGDGLPDFFQFDGTLRYWRNLGGGKFDQPREMSAAPAGLRLADPGVQLIDADGDSRVDLLVTAGPLAGYFPTGSGGHWSRESFQRYEVAPSFSLEDPEVRLVDLDGDGVTDAVRSGTRFECFFNDPQKGWSRTRRVERRDIEDFPNVSFSDPRVRFADISGDGLQDIVLVHDGNIAYWPNLGHGDWGKRVSMRNSPRYPFDYDPRRVLLGDIDGDGLADLVYVDHNRVLLYLNRGGNGWSDPVEILGTPRVSDIDDLRLVDLLGSGVGGLLLTGQSGLPGRPHMFFLDFTGGLKPYLLNKMDNHMGALTRVAYEPSTRFFLEDERNPATRWQTSLPFPVQVVARVEVVDAISRGKLTTEYRYRHGYWDGAEREFRGFGRVDQRDTEVFDRYHGGDLHAWDSFESVSAEFFSPPTETRTWFHLGPAGPEFGDWRELDFGAEFFAEDPQRLQRPSEVEAFLRDGKVPRRVKRDAIRSLRGRVLRTELYALDGSTREDRPFTVTEQLYGLREEEAPADPADQSRRRIFFPHARAQRSTQWERGDDPMTRFAFTDDHDAYGQPRSETGIACPRGWRGLDDISAEPYLATHGRTVFAEPSEGSEVHIRDRVAGATSYEIVNDGNTTVEALRDAAATGEGLKVIGQSFSYYDGEAFTGLPFGEVGAHGAVTRSESLVLTEEILQDVYKSGDDVADPPELPPYLRLDALPDWTPEYPQAFRDAMDALPPLAGYSFYAGDTERQRGYFAPGARHRYDFHDPTRLKPRGNLEVVRAPLGDDAGGRDTVIDYDAYELLLLKVTDPLGLTTEARYDLRLFQPLEITDPNGNRTRFAYTPLGLLARTVVMGKEGEAVGDSDEVPGQHYHYDHHAFRDRGAPVSVRGVQREHHVNDVDVPLPERDDSVETVEYSDGFGRLVQTRTQAEDVTFGDPVFGGGVLPADQSEPPGDAVGRRRTAEAPPNVVVSGLQVYDNKGRVVESYEPFFDTGFGYRPPGAGDLGQKATLFYDPLGRGLRSLNPDGSEQRAVYGVPGSIATPDLGNPAVFEPTPWESYSYDENDNAGRSHDAGYASHFNTPGSVRFDALGRSIESTARNGQDPAEWFVTRSRYDIRGNLLTLTDALGREAFRYTYDLADNPLRIENIDSGVRRRILGAVGNELEARDGKGALGLQDYDVAQRPLRSWARDGAEGAVTLRQRLSYGDGGSRDQAPAERAANRALNRLGALHRQHDEAGLLVAESYDFKGNLLEKTRRVIRDEAILSVFPSSDDPDWAVEAFRVDWQPPGRTLAEQEAQLLDPTVYRTSEAYDALGRVTATTYPQDVEGKRKVLRPLYNRAGVLERVTLDGEVFVERIAYDAKGQRSLLALGNGVMTRYAYDPETFRLRRLRSEGFTKPDELVYRPGGAALQDLGYVHDRVGNIEAIRDRTPDSGIPDSALGRDALDRSFAYDPLYRLISATGRECDRPPSGDPWDPAPRGTDVTRARAYRQSYRYDALGNIERLRHQAEEGGYSRQFSQAAGSNRLAKMTIGTSVFDYAQDAAGNLLREGTSRHFEWDDGDRMKAFRTQVGVAEPSLHAHYLYDAAGARTMKLVRKQGGRVEVTVYIDGLFEHQRILQSGITQENNTLHVMDDVSRIASLRVGTPFPDDTTPAVKYHLGDHLGSSNLVIDREGALINREEYTPYGETSFGSFALKRYRFTGKERDEESGLNHHGARYYAPWLGRWTSVDPKETESFTWSSYSYSLDNPMAFIDPDGQNSVEAGRQLHLHLEGIEELTNSADNYVRSIPTSQRAIQRSRASADLAQEIVKNAKKYPKEEVEAARRVIHDFKKKTDQLRDFMRGALKAGKKLKGAEEFLESSSLYDLIDDSGSSREYYLERIEAAKQKVSGSIRGVEAQGITIGRGKRWKLPKELKRPGGGPPSATVSRRSRWGGWFGRSGGTFLRTVDIGLKPLEVLSIAKGVLDLAGDKPIDEKIVSGVDTAVAAAGLFGGPVTAVGSIAYESTRAADEAFGFSDFSAEQGAKTNRWVKRITGSEKLAAIAGGAATLASSTPVVYLPAKIWGWMFD